MGLVVEQERSFVVAACDALLSSGTFSVNMPFGTKVVPLHNPGESGWLIGYADDVTHFLPVRDIISRALAPEATGDAVVEVARMAYAQYRNRLIEHAILGSFKLTMEAFRSTGRAEFGEAQYRTMCRKIEKFDVGLTLILGGFAPGASPSSGTRLACIYNPGTVVQDFPYGVAAIGEGAQPALEYLYSVHNRFDPVYAALYRLLEAKLIAESDPERGTGYDAARSRPGKSN